MSKSSIAAVALVLVMVASGFTVVSMNVAAEKSDRDTYGYAWTDSNAPYPLVAFNWVEINSTGTLSGVQGDSGSGGPFPIGFNFSFYGNTYSMFNISTNGYIQFGGMSSDDYPDSIPSWSSPDNIIALYWDDMDVDGAPQHGIFYETQGVAPNRQLVIEYVNITDYWYSSYHMVMEIILKENGEVWLQYLSLNGFDGYGAAVGIENSDGSDGCSYGYMYSDRLTDHLAIRFWNSPIAVGPSSSQSGHPGSTLSYSVGVTNNMGVNDTIELEATSVEGWTFNIYDTAYNSLTDSDSDGLPDTGVLAAGSTFYFYVNVTVPSTPSNETEYIVINASAASNPLAYDECALEAEQTAAWFSPPHSDYATDTDSDGDYNEFTMNVSLYIREAGWYYISAYLYSPSGWSVDTRATSGTFSVGYQTVEIVWHGWPIHNLNDDGQMTASLELYDTYWNLIDTDSHTTAYYFANDFMVDPAQFNPPHSDDLTDTDSDGLFEVLTLHTHLTVIYGGMFQILAYMYDYGGNYLGLNSTIVTLSAGDNTVDLGFDSEDIRTSTWRDGPYRFDIYLSAFASGYWEQLGSYATHYTSAYSAASLEGPVAYFQEPDPYDDSVADTDADGRWNWLYIDVAVNVSVAGDYTIAGDLSRYGYHIDTCTNHTYLGVGLNTVRLSFPGYAIRYVGYSGYYYTELTLTGVTGELDTDYFTTSYYYWNNFENYPAIFLNDETVSVLDSDSDGLYDYLLANITVNVTDAGTFEVFVELEDWWGDTVCTDSNRTYLGVGDHVFHFAFPGWVIREDGYDPDEVYFYLYDEDGRQLDYAYEYVYYGYNEFETLPATFGSSGNSLQPNDHDLDGTNDTMVMTVNVTVDSAGYYYVRGLIEDDWWDLVGEQRVLVWLPAGNNSVDVEFPGWLIHALGQNGTFWCYAYLYDADMNQADYMSFSGGDWYNDFNSTVPRILSSWATDTPTIDGYIAASEWSDATLINMLEADSMNMVGANMMVMNNATHLFIVFDVYGDTTQDDDDACAVAFDTGNDDIASDDAEDQFILWANGDENHDTYYYWWSSWWTDCSPFDEDEPDHAGLIGGTGYDETPSYAYGHRIFEYSIPLALLGATMGDTLGFMTGTSGVPGVEDYNNYTHSAWPLIVPTYEMNTFGDLVLASHVTIPPPVTTASVTGTMGQNSWYTTDVTVTLSATGGDGGVDHTEYSLDNGAWTVYTTPIPITTDGTHTLRYMSTDAAAQDEAIRTATIRIDQAVPVTAAGKSGSWVWLNATDSTSGVGVVMYRIDGGAWTICTGAFNVTGSKGMHTIEYYSRDAAGNTEATKSIQVEVKTGTGGGVSGLLTNPILWIAVIAAAAALLVVVLLVMRRRRGQQPAMYPGPGQPMPPQPMPEYPPPPAPPGMG